MVEFFTPNSDLCARNTIGTIDRGLSILNYRYTIETRSHACMDLLPRASVSGGEESESGLIEDYCRWMSIDAKGRPVTKNFFFFFLRPTWAHQSRFLSLSIKLLLLKLQLGVILVGFHILWNNAFNVKTRSKPRNAKNVNGRIIVRIKLVNLS